MMLKTTEEDRLPVPAPSGTTYLMKITRHFLMSLALLLGGCVHDGPVPVSEPRATPVVHAGPLASPLLWEATKGKDKTYLFGTVHVGIDADKDLPPTVWKAFSDSPCFVMEADQSEIEPRALMAMAKLPPGEKLADKVSKDAWTKIETDLKDSVPKDLLAHAKPWFVTILYMQRTMPEGRPMDGVFLERAEALKKQVHFLEHWQEAIDAFARSTDAEDLEDVVLHEDEASAEMRELVQAYATGEEQKIAQVLDRINRETPGGEAKMDVLLKERNELWFPRLTQSIVGARCFVAVGAAHLVGKDNLRRRLEASGYKLRRITSREALP